MEDVGIMNIALLTDCYLPNIGGAELVVHNLALSLFKLGHNVVVIAPRLKGINKFNQPYKLETYNIYFYKSKFYKLFAAYISKVVQKNKIDVINIHKTYIGYPILRNKNYFKNIPIIVTAHGGDIQTYRAINYGKRLQMSWDRKIRFVVREADGLIAISRNTEKIFAEMGAKKDSIFYIPNGINYNRFRSSDVFPKKYFTAKYNIEDNDVILLLVGRYHKIKGYEILLEAIRELNKTNINFKVLFIGKALHNLRDNINRLDISDKIIMLEQQGIDMDSFEFPNKILLSLYLMSDIFISPSLMEGFSLVCVEAMAAGLPLVISDCPGNIDVFKENENCGYYFNTGNSSQLAQKISKLLESKLLRENMGNNAELIAQQRFDWSIIAKKYINSYSNRIDKRYQKKLEF